MQRLSRQRCWLFLGLLSTACASPQYIAPMADVQAGPYHIYNCGTRASEASILINTLINTLEPVLEDASLPTSSTTYTTFFKNIAFAPDVYDLFLNITTGSPVSPGPHAFQGLPSEYFGIPLTPQFVCVTDYKQVTWSVAAGGYGGNQKDAYTVCQQSPVNAFGIFGSKYLRPSIVLCPAFWSFAPIPSSSKSTCLTVDPHFNRFRESGNRLVDYQLWVLLHELAHVYIYARSGSLSEVSTANDCMSLSGSSSANNAQNYVFYATNIRLGCTDFPSVGRQFFSGTIPIHSGSLELLEIDANTTLNGAPTSQNISTYGKSIYNNATRTSVDLPNTVVATP